MTDRIHREDTELVAVPARDELDAEAPAPATTVTNADAERAARAKRDVELAGAVSLAPREHTANPGDVEDAPAPPARSTRDDDAIADATARWSAAGGPPAPRMADCSADARWISPHDHACATLREDDAWLAEEGARPATLADRDARWTDR